MTKQKINYFVSNTLKRLSVIALFCLLGSLYFLRASSTLDSGILPCSAPTATAPIWAKLVMTGNTVTCYYAMGTATPVAWTKMGAATINFLNNPVLVGLYIASHDTTNLATGTIDKFLITPAPTYRLVDYDIGAPALMGSANLINGIWNIAGSGADLTGTSDQCNYQSWLVWGDATVTCRITSFSSVNPLAKIGIMIRDGFNSGSDYALFCTKNGCGIDFQYRTTFNNNSDIIQFVAPPAPGVKSGVAVGYGLTGGTTYTLRP